MDRIHEVDSKPWISNKKCNLKEIFALYEKISEANDFFLDQQSPSTDCDKSSDDHESLSAKLETFSNEGADDLKPYFLFNCGKEQFLIHEPRCELKTFQLQLEHAKKMISNRTYKVNYLLNLKTTRKELLMRRMAMANRQNEESEGRGGQIFDDGDSASSLGAIVVVRIWSQPMKNEKIYLEKEILFRHDQPLSELRSQFQCQRDYGVPMDLSDNPEQQAERVFRCELFKSAFFLIEDTFYNDMRDPNNIDLSVPIIDWAQDDVTIVGDDNRNMKVSRGVGPFKSMRMEQTKFEDLDFRLGYPYLYSHQGDCEHLFTISDIRYVPNDPRFKQRKFPFVTASLICHKYEGLKCYMCRARPPHWYTRCNERLPVDPFFFCENCFYSFNYDQDRNKIGKFQAYLYTGAFSIPDSILV